MHAIAATCFTYLLRTEKRLIIVKRMSQAPRAPRRLPSPRRGMPDVDYPHLRSLNNRRVIAPFAGVAQPIFFEDAPRLPEGASAPVAESMAEALAAGGSSASTKVT